MNDRIKKEKFQKIVWKALCEMGDYFSRLGGAGRPWNFADSEIQTYIICVLLRKYDSNFSFDNYVDCDLAYPTQDGIKNLLEKIDGLLSEIEIDESTISLLNEFWDYYNDKLKITEKTKRWDEVKKLIESYM